MSARKLIDSGIVLPPPAYRGNCDCGRWIIVVTSFTREQPLTCECGQSWFWENGELRKIGESDTHKHLRYITLLEERKIYRREMQAIVDVILHYGGSDFPIMKFDSAAEAVSALIEHIRAQAENLTENERNVLEMLREHPRSVETIAWGLWRGWSKRGWRQFRPVAR